MSGGSRLLALRLQGFKSFAEPTTVEFGAGINAVVGPNGSGKSNLVDALRWALGEQGRALRSRRAEDVVFAGSERRSAVGMADVTLVLDNVDRLLPVDYSVVEISRRLFRSGENEYLLNRGRVRLREIIDLLDAAHLADNAFLFIGQGMVDQALSLRPEERRPLFEEVAGVRRHDRRRRHATDQLVEAEANLARVEDIVAELRPQVRRLRIQAEQQVSRARAIDELGAALLAAGHARWFEGAARAADLVARKTGADAAVALASTAVEAAEARAAELARDLTARAEVGEERRALLDRARTRLNALNVRSASLDAEAAALERDRERLVRDRVGAEQDLERRRAELAVPVPERDAGFEERLAAATAALGEADRELEGLRATEAARDDEAGAISRARETRRIERAGALDQLDRARRAVVDASDALSTATAARQEREASHAARVAAVAEARAAEMVAAEVVAEARARFDTAERAWRSAGESVSAVRMSVAAERARLAALRDRLDEDEDPGQSHPAGAAAGRRIADGLDVVPPLRVALEAALGAAIRARLVDADAAATLAGARGSVVIAASGDEPPAGEAAGLLDRVRRRRGGSLRDAIRRDPSGAAHRLLGRAAWVPELADAVELLPHLLPGWLLATRAGDIVRWDGLVLLGAPDSLLERRATAASLEQELRRLEDLADAADGELAVLDEVRDQARAAIETTRDAETAAAGRRRRAEEEERAAARDAERSAREAAWLSDQAERLAAEALRRESALGGLGPEIVGQPGSSAAPSAAGPAATPSADSRATEGSSGAIREWEARIAELRTRRGRLAAERDRAESVRQAADARRARAAAAADLDEDRIAHAETALAGLAEAMERTSRTRAELRGELDAATAAEIQAAAAAQDLRAADVAARTELAAVEAAAMSAREAHRTAEERLRHVELAEIEARLGLEALREQLLVDLAVLGDEGQALWASTDGGVLEGASGQGASSERPWYVTVRVGDEDGLRDGDGNAADPTNSWSVEGVLNALTIGWAAQPPAAPAPTSTRLAALRRRLHEVGSANPFAADEFEEVRTRLASMEGQADDLRGAIERTRSLIGELDELIAGQFRATFRALEGAFDARFRQLFGGGFARLSLTDPADLSTTGVEIVARPPGKKPQALAMLSGGERALTAVALLFAMLEVRPVPFCVLDEVDAALDEANIARFADALRELAGDTQFIVITHNRGTIERADALFGVTVRDDAVSRVVSLRLEEARELARPDGSGSDASAPDAAVPAPA